MRPTPSNLPYALTLAAVTSILRNLLREAFIRCRLNEQIKSDITFTARAPDMAEMGGAESARMNLFLYHIDPGAALGRSALQAPPLRDDGDAARELPLQRERAPLPPRAFGLNLHYLVTATAARDVQAEIMLGYCAAIFREAPTLEQKAIQHSLAQFSHQAESGDGLFLRDAERHYLENALTRIEILPQYLSLDETSRLWAMLQTRYRPSLTYRVSGIQLTAPDEE